MVRFLECIKCGACQNECPANAIKVDDDSVYVNSLACNECEGSYACAGVCPVDALFLKE